LKHVIVYINARLNEGIHLEIFLLFLVFLEIFYQLFVVLGREFFICPGHLLSRIDLIHDEANDDSIEDLATNPNFSAD
jgi:hypothetical protein